MKTETIVAAALLLILLTHGGDLRPGTSVAAADSRLRSVTRQTVALLLLLLTQEEICDLAVAD